VIDAATQPSTCRPTKATYADPARGPDPWSLLRREVADLLRGRGTPWSRAGSRTPRVYSNTAAVASMTPCTPGQPGDVYYDVFAEPSQIQTIPRGGSFRFELTGWSTKPAVGLEGPGSARPRRRCSPSSRCHPEFSSDMINNGETVMLNLHAPIDAAPGTTGGLEVLSGGNEHPWAVGFIVR